MIENAEPWWNVKAEDSSESGLAWWEGKVPVDDQQNRCIDQNDDMSFWELILKDPRIRYFFPSFTFNRTGKTHNRCVTPITPRGIHAPWAWCPYYQEDAMRLSHILIKDGYLEIDSAVHFSKLTDTSVIKSVDGHQRVRIGRLLKTNRPLAESYCFKDLTACVEMMTSDQVVADFLSLKCLTIEELVDQVRKNKFATIWILERISLCGRQFFNVHPLSHGLENVNLTNEGRCENQKRMPWDGSHCTLVFVHTHPSLLIDYDDCAFELAQAFEFFLNDAYVYQIFYPRRASEWRVGRYHEICSLVRSDYRQAYFPHLMRACSFMSEGLAFFQSSLNWSQ